MILEYDLLEGEVEIEVCPVEVSNTGQEVYCWIAKIWVPKKIDPDNYITLRSSSPEGSLITFNTKAEARKAAFEQFKGNKVTISFKNKVRSLKDKIRYTKEFYTRKCKEITIIFDEEDYVMGILFDEQELNFY